MAPGLMVFLHTQFDKQKHRRLKMGTGIPNLIMVFHILLLVAEPKAFSKSTETKGIGSFISSGDWLNE
jgi:hypothetical protein